MEELAWVHEAIWRLLPPDEPGADAHRQKAAGLYRSLYQRTPSFEYRQVYQSLTGKQLPEPAPLPDHPEDIPQDETDLQTLLAQVRQLEVRRGVSQALPVQAG